MWWLEVLKLAVPLLVGALAGWVATRNARKTPHDNLKALVDIGATLTRDMDPDNVVEAAIARELRRLDRINRSREGTFLAWVWVQITNNVSTVFTSVAVVSLLIASAVGVAQLTGPAGGETVNDGTWVGNYAFLPIVGLVLALVSGIATYYNFKQDRQPPEPEPPTDPSE